MIKGITKRGAAGMLFALTMPSNQPRYGQHDLYRHRPCDACAWRYCTKQLEHNAERVYFVCQRTDHKSKLYRRYVLQREPSCDPGSIERGADCSQKNCSQQKEKLLEKIKKQAISKEIACLPQESGTPEGIRTPDLLVRSQTLYPAELPAHIYLPVCKTHVVFT